MFYHCVAAMLIVPYRFELRQHEEKRLFVRLVLLGGRDFIFTFLSKLFYFVALNVGCVPGFANLCRLLVYDVRQLLEYRTFASFIVKLFALHCGR